MLKNFYIFDFVIPIGFDGPAVTIFNRPIEADDTICGADDGRPNVDGNVRDDERKN